MALLPLAVMLWMARRVATDERQRLRQFSHQVLRQKLQQLAKVPVELLDKYKQRLASGLSPHVTSSDQLRQYVDHEPRLRQLLLFAADGRRIHPPRAGPTSEQERMALRRLAGFIADRSSLGRVSEQSARQPNGWYDWFWDRGLNLVFWQRQSTGRLVAFEIARHRLIMDIIAALPAESSVGVQHGQARIVLSDARGATLYQWGAYRPAPSARPDLSLPLPRPLHAWQLSHFSAPGSAMATAGDGVWLSTLASVSAVALALIVAGVFLYRENTRQSREALQRVSFVNQVSHELKTPLTNIRMYSELLQQSLGDTEEKAQRQLAIISAESERLGRLINNVLSFAKQQRGTLSLRRSRVLVDPIISETLAVFAPAFETAGIAVSFDAGAEQPALIDGDALRQIVTNLLSNAEKYAAGSPLHLESAQDEKGITICVRDQGPGIQSGDVERIFEPFARLSSRVDEGVSGTGIGLPIARHLARLHGGELTVRSAPGQGSTFRLYLPTHRGAANGANKR